METGLQVPRFNIDLDQPPEIRWQETTEYFKEELLSAEKIIKQSEEIPSIAAKILGLFKNRVFYIEELKGIAKQTGMDLNMVTMLQLVYEASAQCTSIIGKQKNGSPILARTMEWEMPFLRPLTMEVQFIKNQQPIALCTTWAGYVGVLTGMSQIKDNPYAVSVNFRSPGDGIYQNIKKALGNSWPIGFLVREIICDPQISYDAAVKYLSNSALISPVYFTICGTQQNQGKIITRQRESEIKPLVLNQQQQVLVQTNIDHWSSNPEEDIINSISRRRKGYEQLKILLQSEDKCTPSNLWQILQQYPIMSEIVIYGTVMDPSTQFFQTRLPLGRNNKCFIPRSIKQIEKDQKKNQCQNCKTEFYDELNCKGRCTHQGTWHSQYSDCKKFKCAKGLGISKIGKQHYSCCYSTDQGSRCKKSGYHIPA